MMPMKNVVPRVIEVVRYVHNLKGMTGKGASFHSTRMKPTKKHIPKMSRTMTVGEDQAKILPPDEMGMRMKMFAAKLKIAP